MKNFAKYQLPPILWLLLIFLLSAAPYLHLRIKTPPGTDKIVHAFIYFVLCWLSRRAFFHQSAIPAFRRSATLGAFVFTVVYGVLDEYHQAFVPGRTADIYDLMADAGGALLFVAILWLRQPRTQEEPAGPQG